MDPEKLKAALEALKSGDAEAALLLLEELIVSAASQEQMPSTEGEDAAALNEAPDEEPPPEDEKMALGRVVLSALGRESAVGAAAEAERLIALGLQYEAQRGALELDQRRASIARLIELGFETPASAWEGEPDQRRPAKHLRAESVAELAARVERLSAARPAVQNRPPAGDGEELSESEARLAENMTPAQRKRFLDLRRSRKGSK